MLVWAACGQEWNPEGLCEPVPQGAVVKFVMLPSRVTAAYPAASLGIDGRES